MGETALSTLRRGLPGVASARVKSIWQTPLRVVRPSARGGAVVACRFWYHTSGVSCVISGRQPKVQLLSTVWHLMSDIRSSSSPKSIVALWALGLLHRRVSFRKSRKIRDPTHCSLSMRVSFSCVRYLIACCMVALQRHILYGNGGNFITFLLLSFFFAIDFCCPSFCICPLYEQPVSGQETRVRHQDLVVVIT
jgi:hypothetical protein